MTRATACMVVLAGASACTPLVSDASPCGEPDGEVLFVDAGFEPGGNGSASCPFVTIHQALLFAQQTALRATIHVAAGQYDEALGETFPIDLRGGLSLVGSGQATTIAGTSAFDPGDGSGLATIVVGDPVHASSIRDVTLLPDETELVEGSRGVVCAWGNAADAQEGPNTILEEVVFGPDYDEAVLVTAADEGAAACHLGLFASEIRESATGVAVRGRKGAGVRAVIGDRSAGRGNLFAGAGADVAGGAVSIGEHVASAFVLGNVVRDVGAGVHVLTKEPPGLEEMRVLIEGNSIEAVTVGIGVYRTARVESLVDNVLTGIRPSGGQGVAIEIDGYGHVEAEFPRVLRARNNRVFGNHVGLRIVGTAYLPSDPVLDFGSSADPGNNSFRCNSRNAPPAGADVVIDAAAMSPVTLPFAGNGWDHVPPTTHEGPSPPNGADVLRTKSQAPDVDVAGAFVATDPCPAGQVP